MTLLEIATFCWVIGMFWILIGIAVTTIKRPEVNTNPQYVVCVTLWPLILILDALGVSSD